MLEFDLLPDWATIGISCVIAVCCLCQAADLLISCYRYRSGSVFTLENFFEGFVLFQLLSLLLLIARVRMNIVDGFAAASYDGILQYVLFAALAVLASLLCVSRRRMWPLAPLAAAALTLPATVAVTGLVFPALFCDAVLFWLLRAVRLALSRHQEVTNGISVLSVKEAVDTLPTGLLFYQQDGSIILINHKMEELMVESTGKILQDGCRFYDLLDNGPCRTGCRREVLENNRVFRLGNGTVWLFARSEMFVKHRHCFQLAAFDVTDQWKTVEQLRVQNAQLEQKGAALKETFQNLRAIARQEESLLAKTRVHDVLGQRLTLLLRAMREDTEPDETILAEFIGGLPGELRKTAAEIPVFSALALLRETMGYIGVTILWEGEQPDDKTIAQLFSDICTETATNAVRHGLATQVRFRFRRGAEGWTLTVTDNGKGASPPVTLGGGLQGIQEKLARVNGRLFVSPGPNFTVRAMIPGGRKIWQRF